MKKFSLQLILLLFVFYSCSSTDHIIKNTEVEYLQDKDITIIHDALIVNPVKIHGKWIKTNYEEEFANKKRDYLLYLKDDKNIIGVYFKQNKTRSNFLDKKKYFTNSLSSELNELERVGIRYKLENTNEENYQTYKFKGIDNLEFYGLIGLCQKKIYYISVYNNNLNDKEKEDLLISLFSDMNI